MAELKNLIVSGSTRLSGTTYANKITGLSLPTNNTDAASKEYVDGQIASVMSVKNSIANTLSSWGIGITSTSSLSDIYTALSGITKRTSLSVSGKTVTANAGFYSTNVSTSVATGSYEATVNSHSITTVPKVTPSVGGTITSIATSTKPSGTDGTNYYTIDPGGSVTTAGVSTASAKATGIAGYISSGTNISYDSTVNITPTINAGTNYYIPKGAVSVPNTTITPGNLSISVSGNTITATLAQTTKSVSPSVTTGYVSGGTSGTMTVSSKTATATISSINVYKGTSAPSSSTGNDGDIWILY